MPIQKSKQQKEEDIQRLKELWINTSITKRALAKRFGYSKFFVQTHLKGIKSKHEKAKGRDSEYV